MLRHFPRPCLATLLLAAALAITIAGPVVATDIPPIRFSEDADRLGLAFHNSDAESIAWVDYNRDGWQDLWLSAHWMWTRFYRSKLYLNRDGKQFHNRWPALHHNNFRTDAHATAWVDADNDGDPDLFVVGGGQSGRAGEGDPNLLFLQEAGLLRENGAGRGLANATGRGRLAYWFDDNRDGLLDVMLANVARADGLPSHNRLLHQRAGGHFAPAPELPPALRSSQAGQLFLAPGPLPAWLARPLNPEARGQRLWLAESPRRVAVGDFGGDAELDYIVYTPPRVERGVCQVKGRGGALLAYLPAEAGAHRQFAFSADGPVALNIDASPAMQMYFGDNDNPEDFRSQMLSPVNSEFHSREAERAAPRNSLAIRYDPARSRWHIAVQQAPDSANAVQFLLEPLLADITLQAHAPECRYVTPFRRHPAVIHDSEAGGRRPLAITNLETVLMPSAMVPGDFDNDGHLDLYVERSTPHSDLPDLLLRNTGDGRFTALPLVVDADYAGHGLFLAGLIPGPHLARADYNNDGALDVFLAARYYYSGLENPRNMAGVPHRLLTNRSATGHWLKLDLVGQNSNRDAIGAELRLWADGRQWVRYQGAGIDAYDQHSRIVHVGLGEARRVDRLQVRWPSGLITELHDLPVDKVLTIVEPKTAGVTGEERGVSMPG